MKKVLSLLAIAGIAGSSWAAGTGSIEGTVVDQTTGRTVGAGVRVAVTCGKVRRAATTDGAGHFAIGNLPEGSCTLTTTGGAYASATIAVAVEGGAIATVLVDVMSEAQVEKLAAERRREEAEWKRAERMRPGRAMGGRGPGLAPEAMPMPEEAPMPEPAPPAAAMPPRMPPAPPKGAAVGGGAQVRPAIPQRPVRLDLAKAPPPHLAAKRLADDNALIMGQEVNGWAMVRVFPVPDYHKAYGGPRDDFRETIYWNPEVQTDARGDADVTFTASDAVTTFRATAEGFTSTGVAGGGQATFQSQLPVTLDAHLPVEVTSGDTIQLPVTIANGTDQPLDATLAAHFGAAFHLANDPVHGAIHLAPKAKQSLFFPLEVVATDGAADVELDLAANGLTDQLKKTIRVVPKGFPMEASASGTAHAGQTSRHTVDLAGALPGSIRATVTMYPSPVAAMTQGMAAMIREPGGCFEQTSSTNYPNVMVLSYLASNNAADPKLVEDARTKLDHGYKLLTGYETPEKGYEWFGHTPGHEALTAYGLMEFADMGKVYDVDKQMVERTATWLMGRRDGKGGFLRSAEALDSFGRASETTTNAYIMWALAEAHRTSGMTPELARQHALGTTTHDPYLLALATDTAELTAPDAPDTQAMVRRLVAMQAKDGSFPGAKETITMSGGDALVVETTALAELALIQASPHAEVDTQIRAAADWLNAHRGGYGDWGNTQATILGLKALTAYTEHARQMTGAGSATLVIDGHDAGTIRFDKGRRDALVWDNLAGKLQPGKNTIELRLDGPASLPYSIAIDYRSARPATSPRAKISVTTQLLASRAKMGEGVTLRAHVENKTQAGVPMTIARIGLPGGMVFQTWQLKELRDKGLVDFYETRPREVILYWRALPPGAQKDVDLKLLAAVPGTYEGPASSAYLYYTAEDKTWTAPVGITIDP